MKRFFRSISVYLLILILIMFGSRFFQQDVEEPEILNITQLVSDLEEDKVESIVVQGRQVKVY